MTSTHLRSTDDYGDAGEADARPGAERVLAVLTDPECCDILSAVASRSATVRELTERCDLPSSTAYRKVETLIELDLLAEGTRIRADGNHVKEYTCTVGAIRLEFSPAEGELTGISLDRTDEDGQEGVGR
ncbi:MAG: helix-turn-helix domain-containing protein [Haloferacaceae archaeon]